LRQHAQIEATDAFAMQGLDVVAHRRKHPPHLVIAPFVQGQSRRARIQHGKLGRQQRRLFVFQQQFAAGKQCPLVTTQVLRQRGQIDLRQFRLRRDDPVQQLAIVGQQQQAGGVAIQAADGG